MRPEKMSFNTGDVIIYEAGAGAGKTAALMDEMVDALSFHGKDVVKLIE
jgi:ATP-dependent exoDNAse (exonuclease V) beta subunit